MSSSKFSNTTSTIGYRTMMGVYENNKEKIIVESPFKFGLVKTPFTQSELKNEITKRNQILKQGASDGAAAQNGYFNKIVERWAAIKHFFDGKYEIIEVLRQRNYVDEPADVQKVINDEAKQLFIDFRKAAGFAALATKIEQIAVRQAEIITLTNILNSMRILAGMREKLVAQALGQEQLDLLETGYDMIRFGIYDVNFFTKKSSRLPGQGQPERLPVFVELMLAAKTKNIATYDKIMQGLKEWSEDEIKNDYYKETKQALRARVGLPVNQAVVNVVPGIIEDNVNIQIGADNEEIAFENEMAFCAEKFRGLYVLIKNFVYAVQDENLHSAQESNIDRLFHFCFLIYRKLKTIGRENLSALEWKRVKMVFDQKSGSFINQKDLKKYLNGCGVTCLQGLDFQELEGGTNETHKFQNPLRITCKRFGNGAAAISKIMNIGQLLNLRFENKISEVIRFYNNEIALAEIHGIPAEYSYFMTRVTFWFFHATLKGTNNVGEWTGLKTGNALSIKFVGH